jgi:hypothetical protein
VSAALSTLYRLIDVVSVATTSPAPAPIQRGDAIAHAGRQVEPAGVFHERIRPWPHSSCTARATRSAVARGSGPSELPSR